MEGSILSTYGPLNNTSSDLRYIETNGLRDNCRLVRHWNEKTLTMTEVTDNEYKTCRPLWAIHNTFAFLHIYTSLVGLVFGVLIEPTDKHVMNTNTTAKFTMVLRLMSEAMKFVEFLMSSPSKISKEKRRR